MNYLSKDFYFNYEVTIEIILLIVLFTQHTFMHVNKQK